MDRIFICESLLKRNDIKPFLKRLIMSDEKWITYDKKDRSRSKVKFRKRWHKVDAIAFHVKKRGLIGARDQ